MLPLILAALANAHPLPPPVPPAPGAVLLRREVYEVQGRGGKPVRVGVDEWSDRQAPKREPR